PEPTKAAASAQAARGQLQRWWWWWCSPSALRSRWPKDACNGEQAVSATPSLQRQRHPPDLKKKNWATFPGRRAGYGATYRRARPPACLSLNATQTDTQKRKEKKRPISPSRPHHTKSQPHQSFRPTPRTPLTPPTQPPS